MFKISNCIVASACVFLAACQGGSSSSPDGKNVNIDSSVICAQGDTFEIEGVELKTDLYDRDNNGCLSELEYSAAFIAANNILDQQAKELVVTGVNSKSGISKIHSMKVIGSSELSNDQIQLHSNIDSGKFYIALETYTTSSDNERLKVYFDDESGSGQADTAPKFAMTFPLPPTSGSVSYMLGCNYLSSMAVNCSTLVVTDTNNIGSNVMTLNIDITFPLMLTFAEQSLPKAGFIIATFCDIAGDKAACLSNYAQVEASFN